ncbi:hypothetical protein [Streptomyces sp. BK340]|uniref:hypothetical protein n=1 Tax=Streptomyces sp. BK340 TaxID=2572903 RepID=UPI0011A251FD|nr:hypothetical protein [Streptomyces sp. BK340]TVZ92881.1 hypothetical protein FB157_107183 [Streptomyces sp. BK340]
MLDRLDNWGTWLRAKRDAEEGDGLAPENDAGRDILRSGFEPCLAAVLRLSAWCDAVRGDKWDPRWFTTGLARSGRLARAAELAYTISDQNRQGDVLVELVQAAAGAGDLRGAQALVESIPRRPLRDRALVALLLAGARTGAHDRAAALAEGLRYPHEQLRAWAMLAKVAACNGDTRHALRFAARAEEMSRHVPADELWSVNVLVLLVEVAAATGDQVRAGEFADRVEDFARAWRNRYRRLDPEKERMLAAVLASEARRGDLDRIDALLRRSPRAPLDGAVLAAVLDAVADTAGQDVALALADRAETLLGTDDELFGRDDLLRAVTLLLARHGQVERATALTDSVDSPEVRAQRLAHIVREVARRGDWDRAEAVVHSIAYRWAQAEALVEVVRELARHGDWDRAEALARSIPYRSPRTEAMVVLATAAEPSQARRFAAQAVVLDGWSSVFRLLDRIAPGSAAAVVDQMVS